MSIVFACIPEMLKPKVKEAFPEVTFFKVDELDESMHGKAKTPRKKREKKVEVKDNDSNVS
jgi:hypothetical protein